MIDFFARHPTAANLVMVAFLALGIAAAPSVKRETFPEIPAENIEVRIPYPGAAAEEIETAICQRIEDAVDGIENLEEKRCEAREGLAIATLEMEEGGRIDRFLEDIKTEVEAIDTFPEDIEPPVIRQLERTDFVASVAVAGPTTPPELKAYAEGLKDRLLQLDGVSKIDIEGFAEHQFRIEVPALTLRQHGLSVDDLAATVANQSVNLPTGSVEAEGGTVLIRFADERHSPAEFEDLVVVGAESGAELRLGDIATISDRFELDEEKNVFNGQRAAYLVVSKAKADDTLEVMDGLQAALEKERARAPPSVTLAITQDVSSIVRDRLSMLVRNGAQGLVLVFLVMWAFFGLRYSFWVAMGLPVSFLGAIAAMAVLGYSFDMISMVGLLIGVGLLMDDAIVIAENINAMRRHGHGPLESAIHGTRQVFPGVLSSFLTTVCVFGGLAFLSGHIGAVMKVMPVILIMVLSVSLVEAFLILPHHLAHAMPGHEKPPSAFRRRFEAGIDWLRERVMGRIVDWCIEWRYLAFGLVVMLLLVSVSAILGGSLKFRAFPDLEGDVMEARLLLPQGTPLERTEQVVDRLLGALETVNREFKPDQPDQQDLIRNVGIQYGKNTDASESGPHVATISVDLLPSERRRGSIDDVMHRWREVAGRIPDVIAIKFAERQIGPAGRPIDIRLSGHDLEALKGASLALQDWLDGYRGVYDLSDDLRPGKPEIRVRLREGATALGLTARDIANQLRSAFQGREADEIQVGAESYEIEIRLAEADRDSLADLDYFTVTAPGGEQVPLETVAVLDHGRGYARINRVDGLRTVTIRGDVDTEVANAAEIIGDVAQRFRPELETRFPGVRIAYQGQAKESQETGASMRRNFLLGLLGVFLILSFQFRSYVEPFVVMTAIPLGLIGVVAGHLLLGYDLSMPSLVGAASLAGVVVNDSILLVRFIKLHRRLGDTVEVAAKKGARRRFRPILLTSLTTVAGLLPLLTEQSLQAQVLAPLVTSLAFGLFVATVFILAWVPLFYVILDDFGLTATIEMDEPMPEAEEEEAEEAVSPTPAR